MTHGRPQHHHVGRRVLRPGSVAVRGAPSSPLPALLQHLEGAGRPLPLLPSLQRRHPRAPVQRVGGRVRHRPAVRRGDARPRLPGLQSRTPALLDDVLGRVRLHHRLLRAAGHLGHVGLAVADVSVPGGGGLLLLHQVLDVQLGAASPRAADGVAPVLLGLARLVLRCLATVRVVGVRSVRVPLRLCRLSSCGREESLKDGLLDSE